MPGSVRGDVFPRLVATRPWFVVAPARPVVDVHSSGAIGRLVPEDVIGLISHHHEPAEA